MLTNTIGSYLYAVLLTTATIMALVMASKALFASWVCTTVLVLFFFLAPMELLWNNLSSDSTVRTTYCGNSSPSSSNKMCNYLTVAGVCAILCYIGQGFIWLYLLVLVIRHWSYSSRNATDTFALVLLVIAVIGYFVWAMAHLKLITSNATGVGDPLLHAQSWIWTIGICASLSLVAYTVIHGEGSRSLLTCLACLGTAMMLWGTYIFTAKRINDGVCGASNPPDSAYCPAQTAEAAGVGMILCAETLLSVIFALAACSNTSSEDTYSKL